MMATHYLLIGGGLAASQAAKQLRRQNSNASILLVGDEPWLPYDRPPLSKEYLRGQKTQTALFFDQASYYRDNRIDTLLGVRVQTLHPDDKTAGLDDDRTLRFERALIATGGRPIRLSLPGHDLPGVHYLRTMSDAEAITADASSGRRAVVIGAGFIGMELAASLTQRGVHVTVVEHHDHIWPRFADVTLATMIQNYCMEKSVSFTFNNEVLAIRGPHRVTAVELKSGATLPCEFVCIGVGIVPNTELAQQAGLTVDNGIAVNEYLQSSHPDIYAAGDVANYVDPLFGKRRRVEHWGHAEYGGQLAAQNMAGARAAYDLLTYVWSDIFDLHLEFAGDESQCDTVLVRGRLEDRSFTVLYLEQHRLTAYFAMNANAKEFPALQRLIRRRQDLRGKERQLQDPTVSLKTL